MAYHVKVLGERSIRIRIGDGEVISVGRDPECDLSIDEPLVSRRHCELEGGRMGLIVRDLKSRNGTHLNGVPVDGEVIARPGDKIRVGETPILVERHREMKRGAHQVTGIVTAESSGERLPTIDGYEVVRELSEGETGTVYHALHQGSGRAVALKRLGSGARKRMRERFVRSARALARLDHPNIGRVIDVVERGARPFFTMELLDGETLAEIVRKDPLGSREALSIGKQVARALRLAHAEGVIHRNVTPDHVIVLAGGVAKLIGFGSVKDLEDEAAGRLTQLGDLLGDMSYSSPEQAEDPRSADHRSDLYSLGATLFHAVTGRPPFKGGQVAALRQVLTETPPRLKELLPSVSVGLDRIVARLLAKDPAERYASADALEAALDDALLGAFPLSPDPDGADAPDVLSSTPARGIRAKSLDKGTKSMPVVGGGETRSFGGGFSGLELLEIIQFLELHTKDGRLVVRTAGATGEIHLRGGVIVRASAGDLDGEPAARRLLSAEEGAFEFHNLRPGEEAIAPADATVLSLAPAILALELMRARDEASRLQ